MGLLSWLPRTAWPERVAVTGADLAGAAGLLAAARAAGTLSTEDADRRRALVSDARNLGQLRAALSGVPGAPPAGLLLARRIVTLAWLVLTAAQIVVWLLVCVLGREMDGPWWLWSSVPGAVVVLALHLVTGRPGPATPGAPAVPAPARREDGGLL